MYILKFNKVININKNGELIVGLILDGRRSASSNESIESEKI